MGWLNQFYWRSKYVSIVSQIDLYLLMIAAMRKMRAPFSENEYKYWHSSVKESHSKSSSLRNHIESTEFSAFKMHFVSAFTILFLASQAVALKLKDCGK